MHTTIEAVSVHADLIVVQSGRQHGNMDPRFGTEAQWSEARARFLSRLGCARNATVSPLNGPDFLDLEKSHTFEPETYLAIPPHLKPKQPVHYNHLQPPRTIDMPTDGLITTRADTGLVLNPADCAPVVFYNPGKALALAHIGRRGAVSDIGPRMSQYLADRHNAKPRNNIVYFGPSIAAKSYILPMLGEELRTPAWQPFIHDMDAGYGLDIPGYVSRRLAEQGIPEENIAISPIDTGSDPDYFSYVAHKTDPDNVTNGRNGFGVVMNTVA